MAVLDKERRYVAATFGCQQGEGPEWEKAFAGYLRESHTRAQLTQLYGQFRSGETEFDALMRRVLVGAICLRAGHSLRIGPGVVFQHLETMEFGDHVFIGAQAMLQGRFDGVCRIGSHVWIGPQAYFDARNLVLEDYVGWGPGAKALGSTHTGDPIEEPVIRTDLIIQPVHIGYGADIGMNASILPGVRVGAHAVVGAGAVVTADIPDYAVAAGVPARVIRDRREQPGHSR